jgi:peptidoglycan-N-acetylglucosamine deacetylase
MAATAVLMAVSLFGTWRLARSRTMQLFGELIPRVQTTDSVVALTFDDGPTPALTDSLIRVLNRHGAKATFFIIGQELAANPELGSRLIAAGHELGNHTYTHSRMVLRSQAFIRTEIERTDSLIHAAGQPGPALFRPPYSYKLVGLPYYLHRTGRITLMTDVEPDSYPEVAASSEGIVRHVLDEVSPGSVILLHPWYPSRRTSLEAVPVVIDSLQARGYRVVAAGELLGRRRSGATSGDRVE